MENTIGDVPIQWFRDEEHIGYDADGRKILKRARVDHRGGGPTPASEARADDDARH